MLSVDVLAVRAPDEVVKGVVRRQRGVTVADDDGGKVGGDAVGDGDGGIERERSGGPDKDASDAHLWGTRSSRLRERPGLRVVHDDKRELLAAGARFYGRFPVR